MNQKTYADAVERVRELRREADRIASAAKTATGRKHANIRAWAVRDVLVELEKEQGE